MAQVREHMCSTGFSAPVLLRAFNGLLCTRAALSWKSLFPLAARKQTCGKWDSECPCNPTEILVDQGGVFSFSRVLFSKAALIPISKT